MYAEGPPNVRGRSNHLYAEGPNPRTRKVVENSGNPLLPVDVSGGKCTRKVRIRYECNRLMKTGCTRKVRSRQGLRKTRIGVRGRSVLALLGCPGLACEAYAEGPGNAAVSRNADVCRGEPFRSPLRGMCTRKVRERPGCALRVRIIPVRPARPDGGRVFLLNRRAAAVARPGLPIRLP
jgi:hypothetical protein